jgi:hypothetical protein
MFDMFKWWETKARKRESTQQKTENDLDIKQEDVEFCISFILDKSGQIYIDVSTSDLAFNTENLAEFVTYVSSLQGQLDTIEVLKTGMTPEDHKSFLGYFLALKTKEAESINSEKPASDDQSPCVSPLDML